MAIHRPGTPSPENCPEPFWHETHMYCPACTWVAQDSVLPTQARRDAVVDVLIAQVRALVKVTRLGGDANTALLDGRFVYDRMQDTLDALDELKRE